MFLSALLQSFNPKTREKSRRKMVVSTAVLVELVEDRCLLSNISTIPGRPQVNTPPNGTTGRVNPLTSIPRLDSLPGASVSVYLDFDGHTESQNWPSFRSDGQTGSIASPVFDVDNDLTTFSDEELRIIEEVWYRVAEDFLPFNVNVTTIDPRSYNDFETILVSIGGNGAWIGSPGGIAFINAFSTPVVNTCYVFSDNTGRGGINHAKGIALAASHEVGHTLGLNHHAAYDANGNQTAGYDSGRPNLGPIMGAPYNSLRETWANAPGHVSVDVFQDDLAVLTRAANRTFQYRTDDVGNTVQTASQLVVTSPSVTAAGIIGRNDDVDMFRFETDSGRITFSAEGLNLQTIYANTALNFGTNLDLVLRLYNASGALLAMASPTNSLFATVTATVQPGTYYLGVSGTGEYGAMGQYTLTGTVIPLPAVPVMSSPSNTINLLRPVFRWSLAANAVSYQLEVDNLTTGVNGYYRANSATGSIVSARTFAEGNYRARVRALAANGTYSAWSPYLAFTVDVPTPATPTIIRPKGTIGESFPTFEWTRVADATRHELMVTRTSNNQRVIFRTNYGPTSYVHFSPLIDGTYSVRVRAGNSVNEFSEWSVPISLTIKSPVPVAPRITAPTSTTTSTNPRIVWTAVNGVAWYDLKVDNLSTGKVNYIRQTRLPRTATFFDPSYMTQGNYRVTVRGVNGNGVVGAWSPAYVFNVNILPPAAPLLTGPRGADDSPTITTTNPLFTWSRAARAVKYELLVNNLSTQTAKVISEASLLTTSFLATANMPQGNYRAWVRGINAANEVGKWSPALDFTIDEPTPSVPTIVAPKANSLNYVEDANPTFVWESVPPAFAYEFTLFNVTLNKTAFTVKGLQETKYTVTAAQRLGEFTYRARVRALNSSGDASDWSPAYTVQIDVPNATTPQLIGPSGSLTDRTPIFSWVHTSTSFRYELLVRDLVRNEDITVQVTTFQISPGGTQASYTLPDAKALIPSTYRFWVRAFNSQGQASGWSTSMSFVIAAQLDDRLVVPDQNEIGELVVLAGLRRPAPVAVEGNSAAQLQEAQNAEYAEASQERYYSTSRLPVSSTSGPSQGSEQMALIDAVMGGIADPSAVLMDLSKNNS